MMQLPQSFTGGQGTLVPPAAEAHWLAAYVVARYEKAVAEQLALRAIESFLPLYRSLRYWKNRRAQVELPLFPSYLFVRISGAERLRVLAVPGVVHIVTFLGTPVEVPDEEIASLRAALRSRRTEPFPYLASGRRLQIKAGPLRGLEGVVLRRKGQTRIIVSVDFIKRSASVEVWPEDLQCLQETMDPIPNWPDRLHR
jgi:transcription termination/antitermination protein NusG